MGVKDGGAAAASGARAIHAAIDTLVLRGFASVDTHRVQSAFATELDARLRRSERAMTTWTSRDMKSLPSVRVQLGPTVRAEILGRQIARAVFLAITSQTDDER